MSRHLFFLKYFPIFFLLGFIAYLGNFIFRGSDLNVQPSRETTERKNSSIKSFRSAYNVTDPEMPGEMPRRQESNKNIFSRTGSKSKSWDSMNSHGPVGNQNHHCSWLSSMTDDLFGNSCTLTENLNTPTVSHAVYSHQNAARTPEISSNPDNEIEPNSVKSDTPTKNVKEILGGGYIPLNDKKQSAKSWISALEDEVANAFQCGEVDDFCRHAEVKYFTNGYVNVVITNDITKYRQLDVNLPDKLGKINVFVEYLNDVSTNVAWLCVSTGDCSDNLNIAYATNVLNSLNVESTIITNSYLDSIAIDKSINCNAYAGAIRQSNPDVLKLFSPTEVTVFFAYSHGE